MARRRPHHTREQRDAGSIQLEYLQLRHHLHHQLRHRQHYLFQHQRHHRLETLSQHHQYKSNNLHLQRQNSSQQHQNHHQDLIQQKTRVHWAIPRTNQVSARKFRLRR